VNDAGALPDAHVPASGFALHIIAEILIRQEQNGLIGGDGIDDFNGVARGAENVGFRFDFGRCIDVADNHVIGIAATKFPDRLDRATFHQAATGVLVGDDDNAVRIENFGRFRHKPDAAHGDDIALGFAGFTRQFEAISHDIGKFLNLGFLIVVRQEDCVTTGFQLENFLGDAGAAGRHDGGRPSVTHLNNRQLRELNSPHPRDLNNRHPNRLARLVLMRRRTKRIIGRLAVAVFLFVLAVVGLVAYTFLGRSAVVDGAESGGVRIVKDGIVSVGIFPIGNGQVALVDAGNDKTGKAILAELARRGLGPDSVAAILLTHGHPDHVASIALFPKAQVMALDSEVAMVEGRERAHGPLTQLSPAKPTGIHVARALKDGETVMVGEVPVQVYAVPGHTAGSAAYLVDGVLFLGDAADFARDLSLDIAPWIFSDSQDDDRASLTSLNRRLLPIADQIKAIDCAHSGLVVRGLAPLTQFARG